MKRRLENELAGWKEKVKRKPLLINGIRQVGKTWLVEHFGKHHFEDYIYVNFDLEPTYSDIFRKTKDPSKILFELSLVFGRKIDPDRTLIFFDEIQSCNEALNSMKYFCEAEENYYVIGAGSYLGITLSKGDSFPVGKVEIIELKPMSFKEFLVASGEEMLVTYIEGINTIEPISEPIFNKLSDHLRMYYVVGGMPEAVQEWVDTGAVADVEKVQENIINTYFRDFSKYPPTAMVPKIIAVWDSIVAQLSKENRKFKYSLIEKSARAREYEGALEWLIAGNYLTKVIMVNKLMLPLKGYEDQGHFKLYMPDIGLLRKMSDYPITSFMDVSPGNNIPFKGAMAENFVLQELLASGKERLHYWAKAPYEMDFILQMDDRVLPVEVKAGVNVRSKSMSKLMEKADKGLRLSMRNLSLDGKILNVPLFMVSEIDRLI